MPWQLYRKQDLHRPQGMDKVTQHLDNTGLINICSSASQAAAVQYNSWAEQSNSLRARQQGRSRCLLRPSTHDSRRRTRHGWLAVWAKRCRGVGIT